MTPVGASLVRMRDTTKGAASDVDLPGAGPSGSEELAGIVERIYQFVWLQHDDSIPDAIEQIEELRSELASPSEEVREYWRVSARGLAELGAQVGRLTDIGGGGLSISTTRPLPIGAVTHVRLTDDENGWIYEFPCVVVWSHDEADDARAGLRFVGRPTRSRLD